MTGEWGATVKGGKTGIYPPVSPISRGGFILGCYEAGWWRTHSECMPAPPPFCYELYTHTAMGVRCSAVAHPQRVEYDPTAAVHPYGCDARESGEGPPTGGVCPPPMRSLV